MSIIRPDALKTLSTCHDKVLFNLATGNEFNEQTYSKFMSRAFMEVTGFDLNLQLIRRIFIEGTLNLSN